MNNEEYYKYLKDENYKSLLSAEMQLDSARQRAMKNTQTQMAAQGLASAGYGSTNQMGIENQYLQGLQNAQNQYQQQQTQINFAEQEAKDQAIANQYNSLTQMMGSAQSRDELSKLLQTQGYGSYDGQNFLWNKEKLAELGEDNALNLQSLYGMYGSQLDSVAELANAQEWNGLMDAFVQRAEAGSFASKEQLDKWVDTWIDTSKMTADQKKKWEATYKEYADAITAQEKANWKNQVVNSSANGKITSNFDSDTKNSGDDLIEVWVGGYGYDLSWKQKLSSQATANSHQKGDIWLEQVNGVYTVAIKGNDGNAYYVVLKDYEKQDRFDFAADVARAYGYEVLYDGITLYIKSGNDWVRLVEPID